MKVTRSVATKLVITGAKSLDPITVFLEDFEPRKGKITINCWTKSWNAYWGGMGDRTIAQFFCSCDEHYIAKNLSSINSSIPDPDKIKADAKANICKQRRNRDLTSDEARDLFDEISDSSIDDDPFSQPSLMQKIYGDEWWYAIPEKANPEYLYLCRIIRAVQEALSLETIAA